MSLAIAALAAAVLSAPAAAQNQLECHFWEHVNCNVIRPPQVPPVGCGPNTLSTHSCLTVQYSGVSVKQSYTGALDGDPTDITTKGVPCIANEDSQGQPITDKCEWYRTTGGFPSPNNHVLAPPSDFECVETQVSLGNPQLTLGDAVGASTVYATLSCQASRSFSSTFQAQFNGLTDALLTTVVKSYLAVDLAAHYQDREETSTFNTAAPVFSFPAATASMFLIEYVQGGAAGTVSVTMTIPAATVISDEQAAVMVGDLGNALAVHTHSNDGSQGGANLRSHDHSLFGYTVAAGTSPTCQTIAVDGCPAGGPSGPAGSPSGGMRPAVPTVLTALAAMFAVAVFC